MPTKKKEYDVQLVIYDLSKEKTKRNELLNPELDLVPHCGLIVYGREYFYRRVISFDDPVAFRKRTGLKPLQILRLGKTKVSKADFEKWCSKVQLKQYSEECYDLVNHNSNHFCKEAATVGLKLHQTVPEWVFKVPLSFPLSFSVPQLLRQMLRKNNDICVMARCNDDNDPNEAVKPVKSMGSFVAFISDDDASCISEHNLRSNSGDSSGDSSVSGTIKTLSTRNTSMRKKPQHEEVDAKEVDGKLADSKSEVELVWLESSRKPFVATGNDEVSNIMSHVAMADAITEASVDSELVMISESSNQESRHPHNDPASLSEKSRNSSVPRSNKDSNNASTDQPTSNESHKSNKSLLSHKTTSTIKDNNLFEKSKALAGSLKSKRSSISMSTQPQTDEKEAIPKSIEIDLTKPFGISRTKDSPGKYLPSSFSIDNEKMPCNTFTEAEKVETRQEDETVSLDLYQDPAVANSAPSLINVVKERDFSLNRYVSLTVDGKRDDNLTYTHNILPIPQTSRGNTSSLGSYCITSAMKRPKMGKDSIVVPINDISSSGCTYPNQKNNPESLWMDTFQKPLVSSDTNVVRVCIHKLSTNIYNNSKIIFQENDDDGKKLQYSLVILQRVEKKFALQQRISGRLSAKLCTVLLQCLASGTSTIQALVLLRVIILQSPPSATSLCYAWLTKELTAPLLLANQDNEVRGQGEGGKSSTSSARPMKHPIPRSLGWLVACNASASLPSSVDFSDLVKAAIVDMNSSSDTPAQLRQAACAFLYNTVLFRRNYDRVQLETSSTSSSNNSNSSSTTFHDPGALPSLYVLIATACLEGLLTEIDSTTRLRRFMILSRILKPKDRITGNICLNESAQNLLRSIGIVDALKKVQNQFKNVIGRVDDDHEICCKVAVEMIEIVTATNLKISPMTADYIKK